jgi:DNA-binding CsgD family transcriptional regulator
MWRNAVLDGASPDEIGQAHQALAAALDDNDRRMGHHAATVAGVDAETAGTMEQAAYRAAARGDAAWAVDAMVRAAELSRTPSARAARLAAAAHLQASVPGDLSDAAALLSDAPSATPTMSSAATSAQLMLARGAHLDDVRRVLVDVFEFPDGIAEPDDPAMLAVLELLFYVCLLLARPGPWDTYHRLVREHQPRMSTGLALLVSILPDVTRTSVTALSRLDAAIERVPHVLEPSEIVKIGIAAFHVDRLAECRAALSQVAADARAGRSMSVGVQAMLRLALDDCMTGQFASSTQLAEEGLQLSQALGHDELSWPFELCLALVAAHRGDLVTVERLTTNMAAWAIRKGVLLVEHHCAHVRGLAALGQQDFDAAYQHAASISPPGTIDGTNSLSVWAALDLVEAAQRTGRHAEARAHAAALNATGIARLSPRLALRVAAASAIAATDFEAAEVFEYALALRDVDRWPFERARVELAYGERLRKLRRPAAARSHVATAYDTFRVLQTQPWASRAAQHLRATGLAIPAEQRPPAVTLTGRELEIASLAASGLSNKEIGAQLFLSPRTVGSRLYRIFPKLGISSRAALRDALDALPPDDRS